MEQNQILFIALIAIAILSFVAVFYSIMRKRAQEEEDSKITFLLGKEKEKKEEKKEEEKLIIPEKKKVKKIQKALAQNTSTKTAPRQMPRPAQEIRKRKDSDLDILDNLKTRDPVQKLKELGNKKKKSTDAFDELSKKKTLFKKLKKVR